MNASVPVLVSALEQLLPPRLARWVAAPASTRPLEESLPAVWWRGQVALWLTGRRTGRTGQRRADFLYALHLAGAPVDALGAASGLRSEEVTALLLAARADLIRRWRPPCPDGAPLVARWRELLAEPDALRTLHLHLARCRTCRQALELCQEADRAFLAARRPPASDAPTPRLRWPRRLAPLLLLGALAIGLCRYAPAGSEPTALPASRPESHGPFLWLGSSGPYSVVFALDSRQWMPYAAEFPADAGGYRLLAPSGRLLAAWTPDPPREPRWLDILALDGSRSARWRWDRTTTRRPLGWLDDSTLLVRETPARLPYEREAEYLVRLQETSRLLAVTVPDGKERTLVPRLFTDAVPAPGGALLALVRAMEPFGAGATSRTIELRSLDGAATSHPLAWIDGYVGGATDRPLWLPDGSGLVVARRPADVGATLPAPTELVLLRPDGARETLLPAHPGRVARPLAIAPDGSRLLAVTRALGQSERGELVELDLVDRSARRLLALDRLAGPLAVQWIGDDPLLVVVRTVASGSNDPMPNECTELYDLRRDALLLGSVPGRWGFDAWGQPLVTILRDLPSANGALASPTGPLARGPLRPDPGKRWLLASPREGELALWDARRGVRLSGEWPLAAAQWHPAGFGFFAAGQAGTLVLVARSPDGVWQETALAPPERVPRAETAFSIGPDGRLAVWSGAAGETTRLRLGFLPDLEPVARQAAPVLAGRPCATWRAAGHLLLAEPAADDRLLLSELVVPDDGRPSERLLARLRPAAGRSVDSCELALDPSGSWLAVRAVVGEQDSILLVPLAAPGEALHLGRGTTGRGLAWSPDGAALAYGLGGTVTIRQRSGQERQRRVTGLADLAWVAPDTLWLLVAGEGAHVLLWALSDRPDRP
ncbi:MAG: hypothetical protein RMK01_02090 [Thermomicrobium sp.]|nr:hypothetical protein [Thermomicrobium sp.]